MLELLEENKVIPKTQTRVSCYLVQQKIIKMDGMQNKPLVMRKKSADRCCRLASELPMHVACVDAGMDVLSSHGFL